MVKLEVRTDITSFIKKMGCQGWEIAFWVAKDFSHILANRR
jgi:hypothetical protein